MSKEPKKCTIIVNPDMPRGLAMNAAAGLSFSLGAIAGDAVSEPFPDKDGILHGGLINIPILILAASGEEMKRIVQNAREDASIHLVDMNHVAQDTKPFDMYRETLAKVPNKDIEYRAVALYGSKKHITQLTGNLKLY